MAKLGANKYSKENAYNPKSPEVPLDPKNFNAAIAAKGIRVLHEKATLCPNFIGNSDSNAHVLGCPLCKDANFIFFDPQEIWGLFSQNHLVKNFFSQGFWDRGTAILTVPTHIEGDENHPIYINYFDRITLIDFEERFYEVISKSDGDLDTLRFEATSVLNLRTVNTEFEFHKDFEIDSYGNIKWIGTNRPKYDLVQDMGELFTVSYLRRPVYRVMELLHEGRFTQFHFKEPVRKTMRFPQQCIIKKDFLVDRPTVDNLKTVVQTSGGVIVPPIGG